MVSESKYASLPNTPPGSKVAPVLTTNITAIPIDTGRSMPMRRRLSPCHASWNSGAAEKITTGMLSSHAAQSRSARRSGVNVPGAAT